MRENSMTDTLKITPDMVGKYVRLRNGEKAFIVAVIQRVMKNMQQAIDQDYPWVFRGAIGYINFADSAWTGVRDWHKNGCFSNMEGEKSERDIIALWVDEEPKQSPGIHLLKERIAHIEETILSMQKWLEKLEHEK